MYPVVVRDRDGGEYPVVLWTPADVQVLSLLLLFVCLILFIFYLRLLQ
ncbi:E5 BETA protein [Alphapapillomavirus 14]|uniref:E5 beta n=1 Tax=Human papillomavirus type 90 TaxID=333769 RepID=A0A161DB27_9PAPI|nr:E5 beta [Human papillomavirus type 90]WBM83448.1 E5 BETA protein [Alphapapillomavirus 14]WAB53403.1 E5 BETA [Human papillomavirus type 90]WAB53568.1 E5 BETA [Human papillomavirus type 90]WAB53917.1 E5 BETA [Human papillomavirus type 90]